MSSRKSPLTGLGRPADMPESLATFGEAPSTYRRGNDECAGNRPFHDGTHVLTAGPYSILWASTIDALPQSAAAGCFSGASPAISTAAGRCVSVSPRRHATTLPPVALGGMDRSVRPSFGSALS
ncbi:hypothetical protein [Pseudoxanthobacter soli]|uniref:hypothetical protein n=1 Tax=Pseudoxanthobacter soli TaxID=433840 RepID=UPI001AECBB28|nr:hypothetical protein [Pseudoxanthobacter soli]